MTVQVPDRLNNRHPRVKLDGMRLYGIIRGDIQANSGWGTPYRFARPPEPPKDARRCSALWRGYVATFRLASSGELELVSYRYPLSLSKAKTESVCEKLTGDFWLVLKRRFSGPRTYVPFKDGKITEDIFAWITEQPRLQRNTRV